MYHHENKLILGYLQKDIFVEISFSFSNLNKKNGVITVHLTKLIVLNYKIQFYVDNNHLHVSSAQGSN